MPPRLGHIIKTKATNLIENPSFKTEPQLVCHVGSRMVVVVGAQTVTPETSTGRGKGEGMEKKKKKKR